MVIARELLECGVASQEEGLGCDAAYIGRSMLRAACVTDGGLDGRQTDPASSDTRMA